MDALPPDRLMPSDSAARMLALEARARWELETLAYPARPWVRPVVRPARRPEGRVRDVVIVGAGQCGVSVAFALRRTAITDVAMPECV